jgi:hypothetical protein
MPEQYEIEDIFEFDTNELKNVLIIVEISSCNRLVKKKNVLKEKFNFFFGFKSCKFCDNILYDEEIMSVWSSNDSELSVLCIYCRKAQVPNLYIRTRVSCFFLSFN